MLLFNLSLVKQRVLWWQHFSNFLYNAVSCFKSIACTHWTYWSFKMFCIDNRRARSSHSVSSTLDKFRQWIFSLEAKRRSTRGVYLSTRGTNGTKMCCFCFHVMTTCWVRDKIIWQEMIECNWVLRLPVVCSLCTLFSAVRAVTYLPFTW